MTHAEAVQLVLSIPSVQGARGMLVMSISSGKDRIVFSGPGAQTGTHSLDIGASSRDRVLAHWRGFVTTNGGEVPEQAPSMPVHKTPAAQLEREIASSLKQPLRQPTAFEESLERDRRVREQRAAAGIGPAVARQPHVRRMVVVTFWGDPQHKAGGKQQLGEFTRMSGDRYARAWLANSQRFAKYEIDTQQRGIAYYGGPVAPGDVPAHGVKDLQPATLKDLKRFHFKLPSGHTLAESAELDAERANNCAYCGKPTRKGSALIDGQTAHKSCIKEFEK